VTPEKEPRVVLRDIHSGLCVVLARLDTQIIAADRVEWEGDEADVVDQLQEARRALVRARRIVRTAALERRSGR
jgi:hypothetical protein